MLAYKASMIPTEPVTPNTFKDLLSIDSFVAGEWQCHMYRLCSCSWLQPKQTTLGNLAILVVSTAAGDGVSRVALVEREFCSTTMPAVTGFIFSKLQKTGPSAAWVPKQVEGTTEIMQIKCHHWPLRHVGCFS